MFVFFFKQKTAYEMRISDWSSDVCSSDLELIEVMGADHILFGSDYPHPEGLAEPCSYLDHLPAGLSDDVIAGIMGGNLATIMKVPVQIGRASCRERVCQYV